MEDTRQFFRESIVEVDIPASVNLLIGDLKQLMDRLRTVQIKTKKAGQNDVAKSAGDAIKKANEMMRHIEDINDNLDVGRYRKS